MTLKRTITTEIEVSPENVAELFCKMDDLDQVRFFNTVAEIAANWENGFEYQISFLVNNTTLTNDARNIMKTIGDYLEDKP